MTKPPSLSSAFLGVFALLGLGLIVLGTGKSQTGEKSAAEIIQFLTDPAAELSITDKNYEWPPERDRAAANSLVALGPAAIPDLEAAFDRIGRQGPLPFRSKWLLFAYAKIRGRAAFQRLRAMADNPRWAYLSTELDGSLAVALGLTSYISASRIAYSIAWRVPLEPRHALDQLILAWLKGDRPQVEEVLGPHARLALGSLAAGRSWPDLRDEMWRGASSSGSALGYRFDDHGDWSEPDETLDQGLQDRRFFVSIDPSLAEPDLLIQFVSISGGGCGSREIGFTRVGVVEAPVGGLTKYVIDDPDPKGLLRIITGCAVARPAHGSP
jgi:hypothetical protein